VNKRYKFKFESVLKLKRFNEDKVKNQLGELEKLRQGILAEIGQTNTGIDTYYQDQETLAEKAQMKDLAHYPNVIWANRKKREKLKAKLLDLEKQVEVKQVELAKARGEVKVFDKLREEDLREFKLKIEKKEDQDREENFQMRSFFLDRVSGERE
jgi:flagellar export protein FliJ